MNHWTDAEDELAKELYFSGSDDMNDRELLELAAKAAGVEISQWSNCQAGGFIAKGSAYLDSWGDKRIPRDFWNPLTDDGDALRLAVKLKMSVRISENYCGANLDTWNTYHEKLNNDPYAATRRAIVRAAAEIGKGMK